MMQNESIGGSAEEQKDAKGSKEEGKQFDSLLRTIALRLRHLRLWP